MNDGNMLKVVETTTAVSSTADDQFLTMSQIAEQMGCSRTEVDRMRLTQVGEVKDSGGRMRKTYSLEAAKAYAQQQQQIRAHLKDLKKAEKATENLSDGQKQLVLGNGLTEIVNAKSKTDLLQIISFSFEALFRMSDEEVAVLKAENEALKQLTHEQALKLAALNANPDYWSVKKVRETFGIAFFNGCPLSPFGRTLSNTAVNLGFEKVYVGDGSLDPANPIQSYHKDVWAFIGYPIPDSELSETDSL